MSGGRHRKRMCVCVCVSVLTGEVGLEASFAHKFSHNVDRLSSGAHGQQLDQLRVMEAFQRLKLLHKLVLLRVLWRRKIIISLRFTQQPFGSFCYYTCVFSTPSAPAAATHPVLSPWIHIFFFLSSLCCILTFSHIMPALRRHPASVPCFSIFMATFLFSVVHIASHTSPKCPSPSFLWSLNSSRGLSHGSMSNSSRCTETTA